MTKKPSHGRWIIFFSFIVALLLTILPLPEWARLYRPEWVALVLIYWCLALPERVGVGTGWLAGIALDVLTGSLLGLHALGLTCIAWLAVKLHQRIRVHPLWQQAFSVLLLLALQQMLALWVYGITGHPPTDMLHYWAPSLVGMLLWPWLFVILRDTRRRFRVS